MSSITINSVPSGADVSIDGEFVGVTPVIIGGGDLQEFRDTCFTNEPMSCSWDVLKVWLEDHRVSGFWWDMTEEERRVVAIKAIENTEGFHIQVGSWSRGAPDCGGSDGTWYAADCGPNAIMRYLKFQSPLGLVPYPEPIDSCYYRYYMDGIINQCYRHDAWYDLPGHFVVCGSASHGHFMASIQVNQDLSSMDSWIIFQYNNVDIKPGHDQIPFGTTVRFNKLTHAGCDSSGGSKVAEFEV